MSGLSADGTKCAETGEWLVGRADLGPVNDFNQKYQGADGIGPLIRQGNF
jgi:hypothetical protein